MKSTCNKHESITSSRSSNCGGGYTVPIALDILLSPSIFKFSLRNEVGGRIEFFTFTVDVC